MYIKLHTDNFHPNIRNASVLLHKTIINQQYYQQVDVNWWAKMEIKLTTHLSYPIKRNQISTGQINLYSGPGIHIANNRQKQKETYLLSPFSQLVQVQLVLPIEQDFSISQNEGDLSFFFFTSHTCIARK